MIAHAPMGAASARPTPHRRRARVPVLDAVRANPERIRAVIEANTTRMESTGCLIWNGFGNADGRARMMLDDANGQRFMAVTSRVVYALEHDVDPGARMVLHGECDRAECVAIEHLRLGTAAENVRDMLERGRARIGEDHPFAKLREIDVEFILSKLATHTDAEIAAALGHVVCRRTIRSIRDGDTWAHVTGIPRRRAVRALDVIGGVR